MKLGDKRQGQVFCCSQRKRSKLSPGSLKASHFWWPVFVITRKKPEGMMATQLKQNQEMKINIFPMI